MVAQLRLQRLAKLRLLPLRNGRPHREVGRQLLVGQGRVGHGAAAVPAAQPLLDGAALVRVAVRRHHRVLHQLLGDGADEHGRRLAALLGRPRLRLVLRTGRQSLEGNHDLRERGPVRPVVGAALQRELRQHACVLQRPAAPTTAGRGVQRVVDEARPQQGGHPVVQRAAVLAAREPPRHKLQQRHTERVGVTRWAKSAGVEVLGVDVVERADR
mmetsp:Transcript_44930/g.114893  ORF Transcript_44930/g.114893 Transcript_44930/m.114893 type:complete len:214 (-) Transcript_44930:1279-1920(-)